MTVRCLHYVATPVLCKYEDEVSDARQSLNTTEETSGLDHHGASISKTSRKPSTASLASVRNSSRESLLSTSTSSLPIFSNKNERYPC